MQLLSPDGRIRNINLYHLSESEPKSYHQISLLNAPSFFSFSTAHIPQDTLSNNTQQHEKVVSSGHTSVSRLSCGQLQTVLWQAYSPSRGAGSTSQSVTVVMASHTGTHTFLCTADKTHSHKNSKLRARKRTTTKRYPLDSLPSWHKAHTQDEQSIRSIVPCRAERSKQTYQSAFDPIGRKE